MRLAIAHLCTAPTSWLAITVAALLASAGGSGAQRAPTFFEEVPLDPSSAVVYAGDSDDALLLPEITGPGVGLFDADNDGDLDIVVPSDPRAKPARPIAAVLLDNRLTDDADLSFGTPTPIEASTEGLAMGVAIGDVDRDGWLDVYVARLGPNLLLSNQNGTLRESTDAGAIAGDEWSVSAALVDLDGDGWLDLYVVNYLVWSPEDAVTCYGDSSRRDYCGPAAYPPVADRLYRNRGDGTFEPWFVSVLAANPGPGLGVLPVDVNGDHRLDLLVANDGARNHLWVLEGDQLTDHALLLGVAVNARGLPEASMGLAAGDIDGDSDEDVYITHLTGETGTLYRFDDGLLYTDVTTQADLGPVTFDETGFGTALIDFENDGDLDLLIANGAVRLPSGAAESSHALGQANQAFLNDAGSFAAVADSMPESFLANEASRGLAAGDLDNDGAVDFAVANNGGPLRVYRNIAGTRALRLGVSLGGVAEGALVKLVNGQTGSPRDGSLTRTSRRNSSYASANDPRVVFGLASFDPSGSLTLEITWPGGKTSTHPVAKSAITEPGARGSYLVIEPPR